MLRTCHHVHGNVPFVEAPVGQNEFCSLSHIHPALDPLKVHASEIGIFYINTFNIDTGTCLLRELRKSVEISISEINNGKSSQIMKLNYQPTCGVSFLEKGAVIF